MKTISSVDQIQANLETKVNQGNIKSVKDKMSIIYEISMSEIEKIEALEMTSFALCTSGECDIMIGGNTYHCVRGSVLVIFPNQIFKIENATEDCKGSIVVISKYVLSDHIAKITKMLDLFFYVYRNPLIHLEEKELSIMTDFHRVITPLLEDESNIFYEDTIKSLLVSMFLALCNLYSKRITCAEPSSKRRDTLAERFLYEVGLHFREDRTVKYYADMLFVSPKYLSVVVKGATGMHPGKIIDNFIMSQAKIYLMETDMTVQQISSELGFCDQSVFGKFFIRNQGCTPRPFRKNG